MIEVIDWTGAEATALIENEEKTVLYVYTPMCGTCQLAKKMLTVVEMTIEDLKIGMFHTLEYIHITLFFLHSLL
ncbi:hypothetical protein ACT4UT_29935, partial [Bacillus sp. B-TM1]